MRRKSLRILHVMRAPVGGLFRHVFDLTRELSARGHQIGIVIDSLSGDSRSKARLDALASHASLGIHSLPIPRLFGIGDLTAPRRVRRLARSLDIDIVHGHGAKGGFVARRAASRLPGCPAVYTPHGGALHYDPRSISGALFMAIERALLRRTDAIIFESRYAEMVYENKVGAPSCRKAVIHNGLAADEFVPLPTTPDAADFVYVGEIRKLKGVDLLVRAIGPLARPDGTPATLLMAGEGPEAAEISNYLQGHGLAGRVTMAGVQPAREMFALGRCVVVPSRAESLPYVALEAAAAQKAIIATNVGGISEIFGPTAAALIEADNLSALSGAMTDFLGNPTRFEQEAVGRRTFVSDTFSLEAMTNAAEALYLELV